MKKVASWCFVPLWFFVAHTQAAQIQVLPSSLEVSVPQAGSAVYELGVSSDVDGVTVYPSSTVPWMSPGPEYVMVNSGPAGTGIVYVTFAPKMLMPGVYQGQVMLTSDEVTNSPLFVLCEMTVTQVEHALNVFPTNLTVSQIEGGEEPEPGYLLVKNDGYGSLAFDLDGDSSWIALDATAGVSTGDWVQFDFVYTNIPLGVSTGTLTVYASDPSTARDPWVVPVVASHLPPPPTMTVSTHALSVTGYQESAAVLTSFNLGPEDPELESYAFTAVSYDSWLTVSPTSGFFHGTPQAITLTLNPAGLAVGVHYGAVTVEQTDTDNREVVSVEFTVSEVSRVLAQSGVWSNLAPAGTVVTQQVAVWNAGTGTMSYEFGNLPFWISVTPSNGTSSAGQTNLHAAVFDTTVLIEDTHEQEVQLTSTFAVNTPLLIPASLTVQALLQADVSSLSINVQQTAGPTSLTFQVWNAGSSNGIDFTLAHESASFLLSVYSGFSSGDPVDFFMEIVPSELELGVYNDSIIIEGPGGFEMNIPVRISIDPEEDTYEEAIVFSLREAGSWNIWRVRPDGSGAQPIVQRAGSQYSPRISPDGNRLLFREARSGMAGRIVVYDLRTAQETFLDDLESPRWMPDSLRVAGVEDIGTARDPRGGRLRALPLEGTEGGALYFSMTPFRLFGVDSYNRVMLVERPRRAPSTILRYDPRIKKSAVVLYGSDCDDSNGAISFDGTYTVFQSDAGANPKALRMRVAHGFTTQPVADGDAAVQRWPALSPTASRIAIVREDAGTNAICAADTSGANFAVLFEADDGEEIAELDWGMLAQSRNSITVSPARITSQAYAGSTDLLTETFTVRGEPGMTLSYGITGGSAQMPHNKPNGGTSTGQTETVTLTAAPRNMAAGNYRARYHVVGNAGNAPVRVEWLLSLLTRPPALHIVHAQLAQAQSAASEVVYKPLEIVREADGEASWQLVSHAPWLTFASTSGTVTQAQTQVNMGYDSTGLAVGTHTGQFDFVQVMPLGNITESYSTEFHIYDSADTNPAVLSVSTTNINATTTRGRNATSQYFHVWNSGGNGAGGNHQLEYAVRLPGSSGDDDWIQLSPRQGNYESRGERDIYEVRFNTEGLTVQPAPREIEIYPTAEPDAKQTIQIALTLEPTLRFALDLGNPANLTLHADPAPGGDGKYNDGTSVRVWAVPVYGYALSEWTGDAQGSETQVVVRVDGDKTVSAIARKQTMLSGIVTNESSGAPVANATVTLAYNGVIQTSTTGSDGRYEVSGVHPLAMLTAEAPGYRKSDLLDPGVIVGQFNTYNFSLKPFLFSRLDFFPWDRIGHSYIFRYTLTGTEPRHINFAVSFDGGERWELPPSYLLYMDGDVGCEVQPGQRFFWWHVASNYPNIFQTNVCITLRSGTDSIVSEVFTINSKTAYDPVVYAYNDYKYGGNPRIPGAEVYIGGRTTNHLRGVTDSNGFFTWHGGEVKAGEIIFIRKRFYERNTEKGNHAQVDNIMYTLWLDSDVGPGPDGDKDDNRWNGKWKSFTVEDKHIAQLLKGEPLEVPLNHSLFEWNLMVDSNSKDTNKWAALRKAIPYASRYLYNITDGQMKLGDVYLSKDTLCEEDVRIRASHDELGLADVGGIYISGCTFYTDNISMNYEDLYDPGYTNWARILIHELGHYAFKFRDEYEGEDTDIDTFYKYRAKYPFRYPWNYGTMDQPFNINTLSSRNDYLVNIHQYKPNKDADLDDYVTEHYRDREMPTWNYLKKLFDGDYTSNVGPTCGKRHVRIFAQLSGVFRKNPNNPTGRGISSVTDRISTSDIPAPYDTCRTKEKDGSWIIRSSMRPPQTKQTRQTSIGDTGGAVHIQVISGDGALCAGARVGRIATDNDAFQFDGYTDREGRRTVGWVEPGESIAVYAQGRRATYPVSAGDIGQEVIIQLDAAPTRRSSGSALAMLINGSFDGTDYLLTLTPSHELTNAPTVLLTLDESEASNIVMQAIGGTPARYQGRIPVVSDDLWAVEISASAGGELTFHAVDAASIVPVTTNSTLAQAIIKPSDALRERDTFALVYRAYGPLPSVESNHVHVPPAVHVALMDGSVMTTSAWARLDLEYGSALPVGVDESGLEMKKWNAVTESWDATDAEISIASRAAYSRLEEDAVFALFAPASDDVTPPAAITDLFAEQDEHYHPRIHLSWTATGDDGTVGTASAYEMIMSRAPLTEELLATLTPHPLGIEPAVSGTPETYDLDPPPEETWYFALRARDKAGNVSPFSNIASACPSRPIEEGKVFPAQYLETMALRGYPDLDPDGDEDNDGLSNYDEFLLRTDPLNADSDGDGMPDGYEVRYNLDPLDASDAWGDLDNDGIPNITELQLGTDPSRASTLEDGIDDGWKQRYGLPLLSQIDVNEDEDNDTFSTLQEYIADTDPFDPLSFLQMNRLLPMPSGITIYLDASTQRLFGVEATVNPSEPDAWTTVLAPTPGGGEDTPLSIPSTNQVEVFRIKAEVP